MSGRLSTGALTQAATFIVRLVATDFGSVLARVEDAFARLGPALDDDIELTEQTDG